MAPSIRIFTPADRDACLAIFDSNTPTFFDPSERDEFAAFLDSPHASRYFVVEDGGVTVACGGWGFRQETPTVGILCWGMVSRPHHRTGLGTLLLTHRFGEMARCGIETVEIVTSQHSAAFFARAGFVETSVQRDEFAAGLHGHRMRLSLPAGLSAD